MTAEGAITIAAAGAGRLGRLARPGADSLIEGAASIIIVWRSSGARTLAGDSTMLETMDSAPGSPGPS